MHHCIPKLKPVLIWSPDSSLCDQIHQVLQEKYKSKLFTFKTDVIAYKLEGLSENEIEFEIERYDFHVIKVYQGTLELVRIDNHRHVMEWEENIEIPLSEIVKVIMDHHVN